ncbi:ABC transporter substrate-binding protein [Moritella yayanosii]|uniref:Putative extracellular solute-binding protein, periplasmic component of ABC-type dipeptide transport system n=1 Tax=Moritella yayanosii TaxID=69539 RepID=A0A330LM89_9GAMM|nr:ABC transporter substrate-binding protein [Moritella yayanosii]SQD77960.1 putative extracellular solute-binding protein, periplasmic component of ABC-type dipeptide transport system [Moritella yayanosii]
MSKFFIAGAMALMAGNAVAACPAVTGPDAGGAYPHLFEKSEFESIQGCTLNFSENPSIKQLNGRIAGNPKLLPLAQRLPLEPLIIAPYQSIGKYGGVLNGISKSTESGTSDLLSLRHVNLVRFSDDLATVVPNVAKSWEWNSDFTVLKVTLRKGHKWSDGAPFTAEDVVFWYNNILMDKHVIEKPKDRFLSAGKAVKVKTLNATTVQFTMNEPAPGFLDNFAQDYAQPFLPKHLLEKFHPEFNQEADKLAKSLGFDNGYALVNFYYGQSDWKDIPTPLLKDKAATERLVKAGYTAIMPTLESFLVVEESLEGRRLVANPYFFQTDTAGNQLPYINEINEVYIGDEDIQTAKLISGEVDYKAQAVNLPQAPVLLENKDIGKYEISLRPSIAQTTFAFNLTDKNEEKRAVFNDVNFRRAMSVAIKRDQINEIAYFGLGVPTQYTGFDADTTPFITDELKQSWIQFDQKLARELLDTAGVVDKNGDGLRDLPSGKKFELNIHYATQGSATEVVEIVAKNWNDVGIKTTIKEVTSDEYRNSQTANDLSVLTWVMGRPLASMASNTETLVPPYGSFFDLRTGMLWSQYLDTKGAEGIAPPATVAEMKMLTDNFVMLKAGSKESNKVGLQIAERVVDDLFIIGTVKAVSPIYRSRALANFEVPKTSSYEFYRMYPYLPSQWYLNN